MSGSECGYGGGSRTRRCSPDGASRTRRLRYERVPIPNNASERALRRVVIHRRITYGVRSEHGARFLERAFSVCATGRQNGKAVFRFLCDYLSVFLKGLTLASPLAFDTSEQPAPVG